MDLIGNGLLIFLHNYCMTLLHHRIIMTEAYVNNEELIEYYGENGSEGIGKISQLPINFCLISQFSSPQDCNPLKVMN